MTGEAVKLLVIGGSWGGIQATLAILKELPERYSIPIILVLHRHRNFDSDLQHLFDKRLALKVVEVEEKESIMGGYVYLAPANYHVLIEKDQTFSLDVSEHENYSRPSIDVTFASAAEALGARVTGILLSGASKDGSLGLKQIAEKGGIALVQDPGEAEAATMPQSAISLIPACKILKLEKIKEYLLSLV